MQSVQLKKELLMLKGSHSIGSGIIRYMSWQVFMLVGIIVFLRQASSATLKQETIAGWDEYLQSAEANLQDRVRPGGSFLWTFEDEDRAAKVRGGLILVAPAEHNPKKVRSGLIHHWVGAMFAPDAKLDEILRLTRN